MYTTCTECNRQFRIRAEQLNAAAGQVMCGYCGTQFNALINLSDEPTGQVNVETPIDTPVQADQEPHDDIVFDEPADSADETAASDQQADDIQDTIPEIDLKKIKLETDKVLDSVTAASILQSVEPVAEEKEVEFDNLDEIEQDGELDELIADISSEKNEPVEIDNISISTDDLLDLDTVHEHKTVSDQYVAEFLDDQEEVPGTFSVVFWRSTAALLILLGSLQFLWFQRDLIMSRYPQTISYYATLCQLASCDLYRNKDYSKVQLVSRDVRLHPTYENSLLVNAVMMNQSDNIVAYPNIQLSLFDTDGRMVSYKQFSPDQYLDDNVDVVSGMQVKTPVHFVLELSGYVDTAVGFEFNFY